jgi:hypothetical protein
MGRKFRLAMACACAMTSLGSTAHADQTVDWGTWFLRLDRFARGGVENPFVPPKSAAANAERTSQPLVQNAGNAWFGVAPSVTIVARDWGTAFRLAGDRLSLLDQRRLTESTRMVLTRVRLGDTHVARVMPFAQLGAGQWRTDPNFLPLTPRSTEIATQVGGGIEFRVGRWQLACETAMTMILRDEREATDIPATKLWSTTIASRIEF